MKNKEQSVPGRRHHGVWCNLCLGIGVLLALLTFIGTFVGEIRWVPTPSMENTIMAHSLVWMDKTLYGARMPRRFFDIPVLKLGLYAVPQLYRPDQKLDWGYHRMNGLGIPQRGDILAFDSPVDNKSVFCKRLIAISGDTVEICHGLVYVNGTLLKLPPTVQPTIEADTIYSVSFPENSTWNTHNYGPLVIPRDAENPYYFVLGDNRRNSIDSRVWGFVRHKSIVGRVVELHF